MTKDKPYKDQLIKWRTRHFKELEKNMKRAIAIRDDPDTKDKDAIDAIKTISRLLGALAPEKIEKKETSKQVDAPFTKAEEQKMDKRIESILGKSWTELNGNT